MHFLNLQIALTAYVVTQEPCTRALSSGFQRHLCKPADKQVD